ncbi:28 kDa heat- and acid-stable phosphoprotein-like [Ruditapes philippinarum]|uniref:28 kDa heat- and acid-stable phosphoprotein-like n=1 Tax=Ruditapes philippinarum TaxID=129788 RepID=UPI00295AFACE|nr:28 kDa heat- and acid-stable phosphoprotein-like [Ruditapes philippinarum]
MPRGGGRAPKKNYKGRSRHFTDEETLKEQLDKERREKQWRKQRGDDDDEEEEEEKKKEGAEGGIAEESGSESDSSDSDSDRHKGVSHLIAIENPNRALKKSKKIDALDTAPSAGPQLSRREREELEKQQAKERYNKMHMEGKTEEARSDMARLAIIRKQREDAAKKREEERLAREAAKQKS